MAFSRAGQPAPALLDALAAEAAPRLREFSTHELANLAAAFATAGHAAPALLDEIAIEAAPRLHEFDSEQLRITARAYAAAGGQQLAWADLGGSGSSGGYD